MGKLRYRVGWLAAVAALSAWSGCGKPGAGEGSLVPDPENPRVEGETEFITAEPEASRGGEAGGAPSSAEGGGATQDKSAPSGREGAVEEADIHRVEGDKLFYLNTYRGLVIYDVADPSKPRQLSRVPVFGYPVEMYISGTTAYALFRDVLYLKQTAAGEKFERHNVSQLVSIDISDIAAPRILKRLDIIGQLREGVSRKIDNTLYVVSYLPQSYFYPGYPYGDQGKEQAWVYSFDLSKAGDPVLVDQLRVFEGGSYSVGGGGGTQTQSLRFSGIAISATSNTLHVVENWSYDEYTPGPGQGGCSGSWRNAQRAVVSIVDVSDPSGKIRLHAKFETRGHLSDQFKHTYVHDPASGRGTYLGIFARQEWGYEGCVSKRTVRNTLEAWDVTDGANPRRVDELIFGKPDETVIGTAFDPSRKLAYAITARRIDPLYVLSYADAQDLKVLSAIDGLSGDMSVFRLVQGGQFLLGVGRDNSDACTGFDQPAQTFASKVAVSVIDVRDAAAARLVQRRCVALKDVAWQWSEVSWNLDQAHKLIGMFSDEQANIISVPVSYYKKSDGEHGWWYRYESAVGLMSWDLAKYDPTKSEAQQTVLTNHGTLVHANGQVRRSIFFKHPGGGAPRRMMLNLSDTHLSLFDVQDLDQPKLTGTAEVAPYVQELYRFGDFMLEHVRPHGYGGWYQETPSEFRVKPLSGVLDGATPVATFTVGQVQRVMKWKDLLLVFRAEREVGKNPYQPAPVQLLVFDLTHPAQPVQASVTSLPWQVYPEYPFRCGFDWAWGYGFVDAPQFAALEDGLAFVTPGHRGQQGSGAGVSQGWSLSFVDLRNAVAPKVSSAPLTGATDEWRPFSLIASADDRASVLLNYRTKLGGATADGRPLATYRYFVQKWRPADDGLRPVGSPINVPGRLARAWRSGSAELLLTQDHRYTWTSSSGGYGYYRATPRLHLLRVTADGAAAELRSTVSFEDSYLGDLLGQGDRLLLTASPAYWVARSDERPSGPRLISFDVSEAKLNPVADVALLQWGARLMGLRGEKLFVSIPGDGVLVLDLADPKKPRGQSFFRTLGWTTHLELTDSTLYAASGYFGVFQFPLAQGTL